MTKKEALNKLKYFIKESNISVEDEDFIINIVSQINDLDLSCEGCQDEFTIEDNSWCRMCARTVPDYYEKRID